MNNQHCTNEPNLQRTMNNEQFTNEPNFSKRPALRSLPPAKKQPNFAQRKSSIEQKLSNEPNLQKPKPVTHYPTSNYGKFQRLQKPENRPTHPFSAVQEEGPIPFLPAKLTDEDWARWKAFSKKKKKHNL